MDINRVKEIEDEIVGLKARWPAHSVPPRMWQQLEELEEGLEKEKKRPDYPHNGRSADVPES